MNDMDTPNMLIAGGTTGIGRALALGLAAAGHSVAAVGEPNEEASLREALNARGVDGAVVAARFDRLASTRQAFAEAAQSLGPIHGVVHAQISAQAVQSGSFHELDDETFDQRCEAEIRAALFTLQSAHALFKTQAESAGEPVAGGPAATRPIGRIFVVVPTIALSGAAGHAAWASACEAQRAMVKSATRQWGPEGILVHCIAPALEAFVRTPSPAERSSLSSVPLGHLPDVKHEIAPMISLLTRGGSRGVTGQTLRMDGGVWLAG